MGNCITAPFRGNYRNRGGARAARAAGPGREWRRDGRDSRDPRMRQVDQAQAAGHKALNLPHFR